MKICTARSLQVFLIDLRVIWHWSTHVIIRIYYCTKTTNSSARPVLYANLQLKRVLTDIINFQKWSSRDSLTSLQVQVDSNYPRNLFCVACNLWRAEWFRFVSRSVLCSIVQSYITSCSEKHLRLVMLASSVVILFLIHVRKCASESI